MANNNNNKILNVPNLRFPEFTGEWKKCKLGDVANLTKGVGISKAQKSSKGNPCILYGELYTTYKSEMITDIVSKTNIDSANLAKSKYNDVIIPSSGETAIDISTARCVQYNDVLLGGDLNIIRLNDGNDGSFFSYQLNGVRKRDIAKVAQGVSVVHLYGETLKTIKVNSPELVEQNKISSLLCLIDQRISTQNKIIDKLESLIKGIGNTLLNDSNIDGRLVKLADICHISTGKLDANAMVKEGEYPFFTCAEKPFRINDYAFDTEALLVSGNGANLGYINYYKGQFNAYQRTYVLDEFTENIQFVRIALKVFLPKRIAIEKSTSNTPYIVLSTLSEMRLFIPNEIIQKDVVKLTINLETKLSLQESLLVHYKKTKHYLLQQMFI